jgi:FtsP/CotA-like multicopper oxidase with cupredoxin domain
VNASADTIFNLQYLIGKSAQPVEMISIDGIAMASPLRQTKILLPPGSRAEFVMTTPGKAESAELITQAWDTGPAGDNDPSRAVAKIVSSSDAAEVQPKPTESASIQQPATGATSNNAPVAQRMLYFSQRSSNPQDPDNFVLYFVTVQGQTPKPYKMGSSPDIVVHQGDVEDWTVENRSPEDHVFHIHQIPSNVLEVNGKPVQDPAMRDTFDLPYWSGKGPYPSVKLRMDFTDPNTVGTFLYHCHILKHEDMGMMGSIQVLPKKPDADAKLTHPSSSAPMNSEHMAGDNSPVQQ